MLALSFIALAWVGVIQAPGANQNAHLALVTALAHRSPTVDRYHNWTGDLSYINGHFYIAKAPGLALATFPWYSTLDALGLTVKGPSASVPWPAAQDAMSPTALWEVSLLGATLPGFILLLLVRSVGERLVPGYGTAGALTAGAASLIAVLATMFFAHVLSTCLGFAAFVLLVRERQRSARLALVVAAGFLAGLAVVVEFPLAIVGLLLGLYSVLAADRLRRGIAYGAGFVLGLVPLLAFNTWAFGSPAMLAYTNAVVRPGVSGHDVLGANSSGFFGVGIPSLRSGVELLFSGHGLIVLSPVLALATVGFLSLWRSGHRAEAGVAAGVAGCFLLYDAGYYQPFGGFPAGPRFLMPALPFLALGVAAAWRSTPVLTTALFLASVCVNTTALVSKPLGPSESAGSWFHRLEHGDVTETVLHWASTKHEVIEVIPIVTLVCMAIAIGFFVTPRLQLDATVAAQALAALVAWRIVYTGAPTMLNVDSQTRGWAGLAGVVLLAIAIPLVFILAKSRTAVFVPALLLAPIGWPRAAAHTGLALALVGVAALAVITIGLVLPAPDRRSLHRS